MWLAARKLAPHALVRVAATRSSFGHPATPNSSWGAKGVVGGEPLPRAKAFGKNGDAVTAREYFATVPHPPLVGYRRISKTSLTGRRGVGDGGDSVCGMVPTRINSCGSAVRPVRRRTISRLA